MQRRQQHLWLCQGLHIHSFGCHIGPQSSPEWAGPCRTCHGPSVTGAVSLRATTAALMNSLSVSWENTFPGGEKDFVGKYFHFFLSLQGTGEQVAFTHLLTPKGTSLFASTLRHISLPGTFSASLHSLLQGHGLTQTTPKHT